jgi:hypothetical protein
MRIALCVRHLHEIYRLAWLNESKDGIYVGALGGAADAHLSHHKDGTQHMKMGEGYHNRDKCTPIAAHVGFKHFGHFSLSLTKGWFNDKTIYRGDKKTKSAVFIDERFLLGKDTLALDVWLTDRPAERELLRTIVTHKRKNHQFQVVAELVSALDYFPHHKLVITLGATRLRDVEPERLMFVATEV